MLSTPVFERLNFSFLGGSISLAGAGYFVTVFLISVIAGNILAFLVKIGKNIFTMSSASVKKISPQAKPCGQYAPTVETTEVASGGLAQNTSNSQQKKDRKKGKAGRKEIQNMNAGSSSKPAASMPQKHKPDSSYILSKDVVELRDKPLALTDEYLVNVGKIKVDAVQASQKNKVVKDVPATNSTDVIGGNVPEKSKAELKAERRAKQEAQRAAKAASKASGTSVTAASSSSSRDGAVVTSTPTSESAKSRPATTTTTTSSQKSIKSAIRERPVATHELTKSGSASLNQCMVPQRTQVQRKVLLFSHLHQYEREVSLTHTIPFSSSAIHPAILKLGLQYAEAVITGANARCMALLAAFKKVIHDYQTPPQKELSRDLDTRLTPCIRFLTQCRPLSAGMQNAIKHIRFHITNIPSDMSDEEAKQSLIEMIDSYWRVNIKLATETISKFAFDKIADGDVILVYGCSSLIRTILCDAHGEGKKFRVIVVDGRPKLEGREMLRRLVKTGIQCSYVLISTTSYVMKEVTKVLLGAQALLANGNVMSRVGSSLIAMTARSFSVPVLICCETYKFCERVQTDSFVYNELGDPDDLVDIKKKQPYLCDWRDYKSLSLLNLVYDVTPAEFVSMVITELAVIPCTSVPVVLRLKGSEGS